MAVVLEQAAQDALEARVILDEQQVHGRDPTVTGVGGRSAAGQAAASAAASGRAPALARPMSSLAAPIGIAKPRPSAFDGDGGVDADDVPGGVEERAAAVAGVDRGVGLDQAAERRLATGRLVGDRDLADQAGDDAARDRLGVAARAGCRSRSRSGRPGARPSRRSPRHGGRSPRP